MVTVTIFTLLSILIFFAGVVRRADSEGTRRSPSWGDSRTKWILREGYT